MGDPIMQYPPTQRDLVVTLFAHFMITPVLVDIINKKHKESGLNFERDKVEENSKWCGRVAWYIVETYWDEITY
jgi:hypothetical protein